MTKKRTEPYKNISHALGRLNELWVLSFLNNDDKVSPIYKEEYIDLKKVLTKEQCNAAAIKAYKTVDYIRDTFINNRDYKVIDTSKKGVREESKKINPSDLVLVFSDGSRIGLSLKAAKGEGTLTNSGLGTIESYTGLKTSHIYSSAIDLLKESYPVLKSISNRKHLKRIYQKEWFMHQHVVNLGRSVLKEIAKIQLGGLCELSGKKKEMFWKYMFKALPTKFPVYMISTKLIGDTHVTTHVDLKTAFIHYLTDIDKLNLRHHDLYHDDFGKIAQLRFKFENKFGSSIKGNFQLEALKTEPLGKEYENV